MSFKSSREALTYTEEHSNLKLRTMNSSFQYRLYVNSCAIANMSVEPFCREPQLLENYPLHRHYTQGWCVDIGRCQAGHALLFILISWGKTKRYFEGNFFLGWLDPWQLHLESSSNSKECWSVGLVKSFKEGYSSVGNLFPKTLLYKQTLEFCFAGHEVKGSDCSLSTSIPGTKLSCSVTL